MRSEFSPRVLWSRGHCPTSKFWENKTNDISCNLKLGYTVSSFYTAHLHNWPITHKHMAHIYFNKIPQAQIIIPSFFYFISYFLWFQTSSSRCVYDFTMGWASSAVRALHLAFWAAALTLNTSGLNCTWSMDSRITGGRWGLGVTVIDSLITGGCRELGMTVNCRATIQGADILTRDVAGYQTWYTDLRTERWWDRDAKRRGGR